MTKSPPSPAGDTIFVLWSDDGQHIRKWASEPFEGGACFVATPTTNAPLADRIERPEDRTISTELREAANLLGAAGEFDLRDACLEAAETLTNPITTPSGEVTEEQRTRKSQGDGL